MNPYLGILGDPAKIEKYSEEFYQILKSEYANNVFHLIGASEYNVTKQDYQDMYNRFELTLKNQSFDKFELFGKYEGATKFNGRIGLFPSHQNQLIKGPSFIFAPYPANSQSRFLKLKAKFMISLFQRFSKHNIIKIAYFPLGGKAAERTKSPLKINFELLTDNFHNAIRDKWFDWTYLEAGSGELHIDPDTLRSIFSNNRLKKINSNNVKHKTKGSDVQRIILPNSIYGGGITSTSILRQILEPKGSEPIIIPESVIIGNVSEENISTTYQIIEVFEELNALPTMKIA
ncbi:MAG: hypothetical protein GPJ54_12890 [Candidatus Heimdallarchaeota archaeon]|nr:hypothetical protein [Candidatus Heimdallarchaeota archaeon]